MERFGTFVDNVEVDKGVSLSLQIFLVETESDCKGVFVNRCELSLTRFDLD